MEEQVESILNKLAEIKEKLEQAQSEREDKRNRAINLLHFISETANALAPNELCAEWYGSYDNPGAVNYPRVTIIARHIRTSRRIAEWRIDTSGEQEPPDITQETILADIKRGLSSLTIFGIV